MTREYFTLVSTKGKTAEEAADEAIDLLIQKGLTFEPEPESPTDADPSGDGPA